MLSKLFKRKSKPTKQGKISISQTVRTYSLELSNMEDSPTYELTGTLTIGSDLGDIVLADPSISPRHCSFTLQDNVVSVIDHGSVSGTFVKDKKIQPGRYIILEEEDVVMVGDLQVKLTLGVERVETKEEEVIEEDEEDEEDEPVVELEKPKQKHKTSTGIPRPTIATKYENKKKKKKKTKKSNSYSSNYATNALIRVVAVSLDLILAYALFIILNPFDEYRIFLEELPKQIGSLLDVDFKELWKLVMEDYAFIGSAIEDGYQFIKSTVNVAAILLNFFLIRFLSTIMLGVSISEGMLGVRSLGNGIWARIGGGIRVVIGMFTWFFIFFDVPAIVSRRTFKEFITFTHNHLSSTFYAILGFILYIPLVVAVFVIAPLFQGLDMPEAILVNDRLEQRVKTLPPAKDASVPTEGTVAGTPPATEANAPVTEAIIVRDQGHFLRMEIGYDPALVSFIPEFHFLGQGKKMTFVPQLTVFHKDLQRPVSFEVMKRFNLKELLNHGIGGNFFLFDKFPELYNFVYSNKESTASFRPKMDEKSIRKFADEVVSFTKLAFELDINNSIDVMSDYTPLLKSLVDYKSSFLSLLEYKDFDSVNFMRMGSTYFLKFTYSKQKPFDIFLPLLPLDEGIMYKVQFDKKENIGVISNKFYKYTLDKTGWMPQKETQTASETMTAFQIVDFFSKLNLKDPKMSPQTAQSIYGYYFEKSTEVLKSGDAVEYGVLKSSVASIYKIIEIISDAQAPARPAVETVAETPADGSTPVPEIAPALESDSREKLKQNFQDLKNAVDNKDKMYFGLNQNQVVEVEVRPKKK